MRKLFGHCPSLNSNFISSQERLFDKLRRNLNIIFATTDKNLGTVAATLKQYIKDGLPHLQDESTYNIISQEEVFSRDAKLWSSMLLPKSTKTYLRSKLQEIKEDPFNYFYLVYKLHHVPFKTGPVC